MSEEIKEILEKLQANNFIGDINILLDYINTLQKNNKELKKSNKILWFANRKLSKKHNINDYNLFEENYNYHKRIEKAIILLKDKYKYSQIYPILYENLLKILEEK